MITASRYEELRHRRMLDLIERLKRKIDDCEWDIRFERTYSSNASDAKRLLEELKREVENPYS